MSPKERHYAAKSIKLGKSGELMPLVGIDLDFAGNLVLL